MAITAVILAAGKSTRMKSAVSKVLHEASGRPMLSWVIRACFEADASRIVLVVGHGKEQVIEHYRSDPRIAFVEQSPQLGTGHAVQVCRHELEKADGPVFILAGDGPLIRGTVLRDLLERHGAAGASASMATAELGDPFGFGRIVRDAQGEFQAIVEEVDCTPEQKKIREVFPSYYCVESGELLWALSRLTNENKKGEYYLTDIYSHLRKAGKKVLAARLLEEQDVLSVNTRRQLAAVDAVLQQRIHDAHRDNGVTIVSSAQTYIEEGAVIGAETVIHPFSFIGRDARIGANCRIGPFAQVAEAVADGGRVGGTRIGGA